MKLNDLWENEGKIMAFYIGEVKISSRLILAPMAGVTDSSFRRLSKRFGAGMVYTELVSSLGIVHKDKSSLELLSFYPEERPVVAQIFGSRPYEMSEAAKIVLAQFQPDILDINLGCSMPKMGKSGGGAFLCRDLNKLAQVLKAVKKSISIPLTIKIRLGWDDNELTAFPIARMASEFGINAIAVHGRTSRQGYSGYANWELINAIREYVSIPVIGSGDVANTADANVKLASSGCAAVMIGRAAIGNPWVFREIPPTLIERERLILEHLEMTVAAKGYRGLIEMRRYLAWYIKGLPCSNVWKQKFVRIGSIDEAKELVKNYFSFLKDKNISTTSAA